MSAKIQIKSDLVGTFCGIFLMLDHFGKANHDKLVDKSLGNRRFNYNPALTDLSVKGLVQCGQVDTKASHVFDYDNLSEERMPTKPDWLAKPKKGLEETSSYPQRSMTPSSPTRKPLGTFLGLPKLTDTPSSWRTGTATPT